MVHSCNPSTLEVELGRLEAQGHFNLHVEFKASLGYKRFFRKKERKKSQTKERHGGRGSQTVREARLGDSQISVVVEAEWWKKGTWIVRIEAQTVG